MHSLRLAIFAIVPFAVGIVGARDAQKLDEAIASHSSIRASTPPRPESGTPTRKGGWRSTAAIETRSEKGGASASSQVPDRMAAELEALSQPWVSWRRAWSVPESGLQQKGSGIRPLSWLSGHSSPLNTL